MDSMSDLVDKIQKISLTNENIIEHFKITWVIKNLLPTKKLNPVFHLTLDSSQRMTSWFLLVTPFLERNYFQMYLYRDNEDRGPTEVFVCYRFGLKINGEENWDDEVNFIYENGAVNNTILRNISKYFDSKNNTISLLWQMIIRSSISFGAVKKSDIYNEAFIKNMLNLFKDGHYLRDFSLGIGNQRVQVHKAIITSKSEYFRNKLPLSKNSFMNIPKQSKRTSTWNVVKDIYTNTIIFDANRQFLNISEYHYAELFQIKYLQNLLSPSEATFVTEITTHTATFTWKINCCANICESEFHRNTDYNLNIGTYNLKLSIKDSNVEGYFSLKVDSLETIKDFVFSIEYAVLDENQKKKHTQKLCQGIHQEVNQELPQFIEKSLLNTESELSSSHILTLYCNVEIDIAAKAKNIETHSNIDKFISIERSREGVDFSNLLQLKGFDSTLVVKPLAFGVHKAILAAHSLFFRRLFLIDEYNYSINDLSSNALESLLFYIYSGKLDGNLDTAFELLQTNGKYYVTMLYQQLEDFFHSLCNLNDVHILLLKADSYNCGSVRTLAKDYIMREFDTFSTSSHWNLIEEQNSNLAREILSELSQVYISLVNK